MQTPTPPKGTRDFYPEEMQLREYIFNAWEKTCKRYGFEKFDAPQFEHLELYTQKSGNEIENQLYTFEDKAGRKLALRPEMTPSLARMVALKGQSLKMPVRWYSIPRMFRYEKMQKGRLREFFQLNVDILGIARVNADAELIAVSIDTMRDLGLDHNDFTVHISSRNLLEELFLSLNIAQETLPALYAILDKLHKLPQDAFREELNKLLVDQSIAKKVFEILSAKSLDEIRKINSSSKALVELDALFSLMKQYGFSDYVEFDIGVVRGLAYYTGIVFELLDKKRTLRAIAGGGRYDRLVKLYGGQDTPATGFAIGDVVLAELLKEKGIIPGLLPRSDVYILYFDKNDPTPAMVLTQKLRNQNISCEFSLKSVGLGKQMKLAHAVGAKIVLFAGGDEEKDGNIKAKNMVSGEETMVKLLDFEESIKRLLL